MRSVPPGSFQRLSSFKALWRAWLACRRGKRRRASIAAFYLDALDHRIKRELKIAGYLRYMDDLVLFADSGAWLESCRADIADWLARERGLQLKDPAAPILPNTQPATFLGFRVSRAGVLPGPKMKRRLRVRLAGADALAPGRLARGLSAYRGVLAPF
jgi:hypothetical protein